MLFIALSLTVLSLVRRFGQKRLLNVNVNVRSLVMPGVEFDFLWVSAHPHADRNGLGKGYNGCGVPMWGKMQKQTRKRGNPMKMG